MPLDLVLWFTLFSSNYACLIHVITFRWPCWRFDFHFLEIVFSFLETVRRQVWHIVSKFSSVRLRMKIKRNTWTKLQLILFQSILLLFKKPKNKKKQKNKTYIQINMTVFKHLCIYLFFENKIFQCIFRLIYDYDAEPSQYPTTSTAWQHAHSLSHGLLCHSNTSWKHSAI